ncbi:MAG: branched-chain amino acid transporter AzlD [Lachnospiraceae bacterium]|nr:branched-chain amino acid transporter AzlD [Lachnospiraceae bacterium]
MNFDIYAAILVLIMALVTWLLRFAPFLIFRKSTPPYIVYLGKVLPSAIIGMLVIYCLKDVDVTAAPFGLPELIATITVVMLQYWKRNSLISILSGTIIYMILMQIIF